mmetsp:Transcript_3928/g.10703  ORF Transcript_3928/g.10703 Transcript_3928/m.10703 type:complete len:228 (-) Transcript_3928:341-1024(-)
MCQISPSHFIGHTSPLFQVRRYLVQLWGFAFLLCSTVFVVALGVALFLVTKQDLTSPAFLFVQQAAFFRQRRQALLPQNGSAAIILVFQKPQPRQSQSFLLAPRQVRLEALQCSIILDHDQCRGRAVRHFIVVVVVLSNFVQHLAHQLPFGIFFENCHQLATATAITLQRMFHAIHSFFGLAKHAVGRRRQQPQGWMTRPSIHGLNVAEQSPKTNAIVPNQGLKQGP